MAKILVLYYSSWGHMEQMAKSAAEGAREAGATVTIKRVKELVRDWGCEIAPELIEQLIITALKMARDKIGVADLKMTTRAVNGEVQIVEGTCEGTIARADSAVPTICVGRC